MTQEGHTEDEEEATLENAYENKEILSSGNGEVDKKLGGGIPRGTLTLVEGSNNTGKSVLTQQLLWGGLQQGFTFGTYTTENTVKSLLKQMNSLDLDISDFFVFGNLKIYPVHIGDMSWNDDLPLLEYVIGDIKGKSEEVVIVDSLTVIASGISDENIINFFTSCKKICDSGKTVLVTVHTYAFNEEMLTRIRSICDAHLTLRTEEVGDRLVKTLEVAKIRGAQKITGNVVAFEVESGIGLRIIPVSKAKA
jgi:flagellar protein FlaH